MMKNIDFIEYKDEKEYKEAWDITAYYSDAAWFTHLSDWIEIENQWNVEPHSFMVVIEGVVSGIVPLFLIRKKGFRYLKSGYKGWGGPAFLKTVDEYSKEKVYEHIDLIAKKTKADWIEVSPPLGVGPEELFHYEFQINMFKTSVIELTKKPINEIYNNIDKKCRYEIRKPEKLGLNINFKGALSLEDIKDYYKIHLENYKRTRVPPNPFWYFENLFNRFSHKGIIQFFFIEENGEKVAAASIAVYKDHAIYLTGSSLDEALGRGLNHYLQWNIIKTLYNRGIKYYEMGEIEESSDKAKTLGKFKESFGGDLHKIYRGIKIYHPIKHKAYNALMKIKAWKSSKK
jgi:hypothetical protein